MVLRTRVALVGVVAVGLALAACATAPTEEEAAEADASTTTAAIGNSLRAAAIASQEAANFAGAVAYYNSLYQQNRDDLGAALGLARNLRFLGDVTQAARVLEDVLTRHPDEPELNGEYGKVLLAQGKAAEAIPILEQAGTAVPEDWQIQSAIGIAYDLTGDSDNAAAAYRRALTIRPDSASTLNNLALSQAIAGDVDGGIALLRQADQQPSTNAQVRQNLAMLLAVQGQVEEAERLVRADLPKEMADANIAVLRRIAARGTMPTGEDLAELTAVQSLPEIEPVAVESVETVPQEIASEPEATESVAAPEDLAAAASAAADDAFATILSGGDTGTTAAAAGSAYRVQLASVGSEAEALAERDRLASRHPNLLETSALELRHMQLASGAEVWRVYAGPYADKATASALCDAITAQSGDCLVTIGDAAP